MVDEVKKGKVEEISLDSSMDDIDDLPSFLVFQSGAHVVLFENWEQKKVKDENWININLKHISTEEETEPCAEYDKAKPGDVQTMGHSQTNSYAMGALKEFLKPIAAKFGIDMAAAGALRAALDAGKGSQLLIVQSKVPAKDAAGQVKPGVFNARIKAVEVL